MIELIFIDLFIDLSIIFFLLISIYLIFYWDIYLFDRIDSSGDLLNIMI